MTDFLIERLLELKEAKGWGWERLADEINRIQGGKQGVTGPTLYRYAEKLSRPRNPMLQQYILDAIERLLSTQPSRINTAESASQQSERAGQIRERHEAYFQSLYLGSPAMLQSLGRDGRLMSVSQRWLQKLGYELHEVIGRKMTEFVMTDSRPAVEARLQEIFQKGASKDLALQLVKKNGEILESLLSMAAVRDDQGQVDIALGALVDATSQKRVTEELQFWQSLVENAPQIILTVNRAGEMLSVNRILPGFTKGDVIGSSVYGYIPPEHHQAMREALEQVFSRGVVTEFELLGMGAHRQIVWYECHVGPIKQGDEVIAASIITSEITKRKQTEERYRTLFERNISGVFRARLDGELLDCNDALAKILGYRSRKEVLKIRTTSFYDDPADRERYIAQLKQQGFVQNYEIRFRRKDGQRLWVMANSSLLEDESGEPCIILGTLVNITDKKDLEAKLLRRTEYAQLLHETALGIMGTLDLKDQLELILTRAGGALGTSHGYLYRIEPGQNEMLVRVAIGAIRPHRDKPLQLDEGLGIRVLRTGQPVIIEDYCSWDERAPDSDFDKLHAVVGVPVKSRKRVIGVLALAHLDEKRVIEPEEIAILEQFAELASIAIEHAKA